jgi:hypothetical protein
MIANELRIGNYVDFKGNLQKDEDQIIKACDFTAIDFDSSLIEPIPLTEEWLIKFGLKKEKDRGCGFNYTNNSKRFKLIYFDGAYGLKNSRYYNIKHVHQLQNLYFALTGEELNL